MRIQRFITSAAVLLTVAFVFLSLQLSGAEEKKQPNIVFLLVDDLGWRDIGCFGSDLYETPNIDNLAAQGVKFTNGYAACTVCSPTRAAIMSGYYPPRTGVTDFIHSTTMKLELDNVTIAEALRDAGYQTWHVGKWHLAPRGVPETEDHYPEDQGFDINVGGCHWGAPGSYWFPYEAKSKKGRYVGELPPGGKEGDYLTDELTDHTLNLIDSRDSKKPFFLSFWYYNVHTPIMGKPDLVEKYQKKLSDGKKRDHNNAAYAAMVESVDQSVGRIVKNLEAEGELENTIFIFTGDNGGLDRKGNPTENRPLRAGKGSAYEGGTRVPTFVVWPGIAKAGESCDEPITSVDYYPTLLEAAGAKGDEKHNKNLDGESIVKILKDPATTLTRKSIFWHYPHRHGGGATPYGAVRKGKYRLVHFYNTGKTELYDLEEDLSETTDLSETMPKVTKELHGELVEFLVNTDAKGWKK